MYGIQNTIALLSGWLALLALLGAATLLVASVWLGLRAWRTFKRWLARLGWHKGIYWRTVGRKQAADSIEAALLDLVGANTAAASGRGPLAASHLHVTNHHPAMPALRAVVAYLRDSKSSSAGPEELRRALNRAFFEAHKPTIRANVTRPVVDMRARTGVIKLKPSDFDHAPNTSFELKP